MHDVVNSSEVPTDQQTNRSDDEKVNYVQGEEELGQLEATGGYALAAVSRAVAEAALALGEELPDCVADLVPEYPSQAVAKQPRVTGVRL